MLYLAKTNKKEKPIRLFQQVFVFFIDNQMFIKPNNSETQNVEPKILNEDVLPLNNIDAKVKNN